MIPLARVRKAAQIPAGFRGAAHVKKCADLLKRQRGISKGEFDSHDFQSSLWKPAKALLLEETGGKCAYCESSTDTTGFGDVEHYRPKSKYWWLAYALENYLASCAICNQKFKKDAFVLLQGGVALAGPNVGANLTDAEIETLAAGLAPDPLDPAALAAFTTLHTVERPALPNPYFEDPAQFFAWKADDVAKEVTIVPRPGVADAEARVAAVEEFYGLNRSQLNRDRYFFYRFYRLAARTASLPDGQDDALRAEARDQIVFMQQSGHPYAGMFRFFAAGDGLPGP